MLDVIAVTEVGITTDVRLEQPENVELPIELSDEDNVIEIRLEHPWKT